MERLANGIAGGGRLPRPARGWPALRRPAAAALGVLLVPLLLAIAVPSFAPLPAASPTAALPLLPEPAPDARPTLDGLVDPLPIVVGGLPDEVSRRVAADWEDGVVSDPTDAAAMLDHAWQALRFEAEGAEALRAYGGYLAFGPSAPGLAALASPEPSPEAAAALAALTHDPLNADRLVNVAVALFVLGAANDLLALDVPHAAGERLTELDGAPLAEGRVLQSHSVELLRAVDLVFGPHRAARLNAAYFLSAIPAGAAALPAAIPFVDRQLAADPTDRTARLLLASLQARRIDVTDGLDRALTILGPLVRDPDARPFADVARGDAFLAAASVRPEAPFLARHLARQALDAYDEALGATTDPGVYAGRAMALALLGAYPEAVAAQERALAGAPGSLPFRLELAALRGAAGDFAGMRESAREALRMVEAGWAPPLRSVRFVAAPATPEASVFTAGDRGFLGYSYGSDRDRAGVFRVPEGGAFVVALDLIPRTNAPNLDDWLRTGPATKVALHLATAAAVLSGDLEPVVPGEGPEPAALLATDRPLPPDADASAALRTAETALRHAGRFGEAAALCRRALAASPGSGVDRVPALSCAGEAAYLAAFAETAARPCTGLPGCAGGAPPAAALQRAAADLDAAYEGAVRLVHGPPSPGQSIGTRVEILRLRALQGAQAAGHLERARRLARLALANTDESPLTVVVGAAKLGELDLAAGDAAAAEQAYDLALAMLEEADDRVWTSGFPEFALLARTLEQRAHLNRGIARLRLAQAEPDTPPDCARHRPRCTGARDDFAAALAGDPRNPVALLNAAWAARLLGERGRAQDLLALAAETDPSLFPALNDLGVLAAEAGDRAAAERAFRDALATAPAYDLAAWNLGVLELGEGIGGILPAQGWLLRAVAGSPSFRGHDLSFKTDERIYQATFGPGATVGHGWSFGRSYSLAAAALGSVTLLAAVGATVGTVIQGRISEGLTDLGKERLRRGGDALGGVLRSRLGPERFSRRWWRAWAPWLVTVPVLVVVTAWPAWQGTPAIGVAAAAMALLAAALAIAAHEAGHAVAAAWVGGRLEPAQWGPGVALAVLLLPLRLSSGPYVGQRVLGLPAERAWWVYLGGPLGNLLLAATAYGLFLAQPAPLLRLLAEVQLAAIGYALLPFDPLDGGALGRRPGVVAAFGLFTAVVGVVFALGML